MSIETKMGTGPSETVGRRLDYCVSGRLRSEVQEELAGAKAAQRAIDIQLHQERIEHCRVAWNTKYRGEYPFNPSAAYTSLIPGEVLSPDLCDQYFRVTQAIVALEEEIGERPQ